MLNKIKKLRGFTLIELIIVIAIIAILAAIAVPAFGQIRQKANNSADLGNARTIYSLVATELASDNVELPGQAGDEETELYYPLSDVGGADIEAQIEPTPVVKSLQGAFYVVKVTNDGSIEVGYAEEAATGIADAPEGYHSIYPE